MLGLLAFVFKDRRFRANTTQVAGAVVLGALVACGWYLTGHLGFGENPETLENVYFATNSRTLESLSFVGPLAYLLELLLLWTDASLHASFGIASVLGVVAGSAAHALATGTFRWEGFASLADLRNQLAGAVLMGFGGVTALGCTIGQGLAGVSTLAIGSLVAVAGIVAGSVATLRVISWQAERGPRPFQGLSGPYAAGRPRRRGCHAASAATSAVHGSSVRLPCCSSALPTMRCTSGVAHANSWRRAVKPPHCSRRLWMCISGRLAGGRRSAKRARSCSNAASVPQLMRATGDAHSSTSRSPSGRRCASSQVAARASSALANTHARSLSPAQQPESQPVDSFTATPPLSRRRRVGPRAPAAAGLARRAGCPRTSP